MVRVREAFVVISRVATNYFYRPEKHYMRGPGPKSLGMIGRRLRGEMSAVTQEPLPARWLALLEAAERREQGRTGADRKRELT